MRSFVAIVVGLVAASALYWYQNPDLELKVPEGLITQLQEQSSALQQVPDSLAEIVATSTPKPVGAVKAVYTATSTPKPAKTATAAPDVTLTSEPRRDTALPTPNQVPSLRHLSLKEYMLELINKERIAEGSPPVVLGDNGAAQIHAEEALDGCFGGHWGRDGLTPYMRYSLAGGYQSNGENGSGLDYCIKEADGFSPVGDAKAQVRQRMKGWMGSSGHRANILYPWHRKVNIGLAWDNYNFQAFQHFEGDYVHFDQVPVIREGNLVMAGQLKNGAQLTSSDDLFVQLFYDPPPQPLTRGQLARTYCYGFGIEIASLLPPRRGYVTGSYEYGYSRCPDPYHVPSDARAPSPTNPSVHRADLEEALKVSDRKTVKTASWTLADQWEIGTTSFEVTANLRNLLDQHGPGVYSVMTRAILGGESQIVSYYSIFHEVEPPDTYVPRPTE